MDAGAWRNRAREDCKGLYHDSPITVAPPQAVSVGNGLADFSILSWRAISSVARPRSTAAAAALTHERTGSDNALPEYYAAEPVVRAGSGVTGSTNDSGSDGPHSKQSSGVPTTAVLHQQEQQVTDDLAAPASMNAVAEPPATGQPRRRSSVTAGGHDQLVYRPIGQRGGDADDGPANGSPAMLQQQRHGLKSSLKGSQQASSVPPHPSDASGAGSRVGSGRQVTVPRGSDAGGPDAGGSVQYGGSARYAKAQSMSEREPRDRGAGGSVASRSTTGRKTIGRLRRALAEQVGPRGGDKAP